MINDEQLSFFEEFGFLVLRKLFRADEIAAIAKEVEITIQELYHGADRGTHGKWTPLQGPSTPFNGSLLEDPRFYDMARQLFGDSVIGLMSDALLWTGDTGWHRDRDVPGNTNTGLKFLYYLDPLIAETGALRVVPGSHKEPFHDDIPKAAPLCLPPASHHYMHQVKALTVQPDDVMLPSVIAETEPGDVIAFAMPAARKLRPFKATPSKFSTILPMRRFVTHTGLPGHGVIQSDSAGSIVFAICNGSMQVTAKKEVPSSFDL